MKDWPWTVLALLLFWAAVGSVVARVAGLGQDPQALRVGLEVGALGAGVLLAFLLYHRHLRLFSGASSSPALRLAVRGTAYLFCLAALVGACAMLYAGGSMLLGNLFKDQHHSSRLVAICILGAPVLGCIGIFAASHAHDETGKS